MKIVDQIKGLAIAKELTAYGISMLIAAETDPTESERQAIEKRWQRWLKGESLKTLEDLEADLEVLGYALKIEPLIDSP